jgi:hypothetical protein
LSGFRQQEESFALVQFCGRAHSEKNVIRHREPAAKKMNPDERSFHPTD